MVLHAVHLCSGYGGFELALRLAGIPARTVAHVERDSYAAAVLVARMADKALDQAPIWSDLDTFDGRPWRGRVDLVTAGLPCQPFSGAGQRRGLDDDRHLWPMAQRIIADMGPRFVFLENVPDVVGAGWLPHVLADLADLGFDAEWGLLSAADVGAPHRRQRFWLLAHTDNTGSVLVPYDAKRHASATSRRSRDVAHTDRDGREGVGRRRARDERDVDRPGGEDVGDTGRPRRRQNPGRPPGDEGPDGRQPHRGDVADSASQDVADAGRIGRGPRVGPDPHQRQSGRTHTAPRSRVWPPGPDDHTGWREWIAEGGPQPSVRRRAHGRPLGLADALHLGGNGLVPSVAAAALLELARRAGVQLT